MSQQLQGLSATSQQPWLAQVADEDDVHGALERGMPPTMLQTDAQDANVMLTIRPPASGGGPRQPQVRSSRLPQLLAAPTVQACAAFLAAAASAE